GRLAPRRRGEDDNWSVRGYCMDAWSIILFALIAFVATPPARRSAGGPQWVTDRRPIDSDPVGATVDSRVASSPEFSFREPDHLAGCHVRLSTSQAAFGIDLSAPDPANRSAGAYRDRPCQPNDRSMEAERRHVVQHLLDALLVHPHDFARSQPWNHAIL